MILNKIIEYIPSNNRIERIWKLAQVDFLSRYYNDKLGLLWALIRPMFEASVYYFVFSYLLQRREDNFVLFLFGGLIIWMAFRESTSQSMRILQRKGYLISNIQFNWIDLYFSHVISVFKGLLFNFIVFLLLCTVFGQFLSIQFLAIPIIFITFFLLCFGTSLLLSVIYPFFKDLNHLWDMLLLMGFWISGIFFSADVIVEKIPILVYLNPMIGIIHNVRAAVLSDISINTSWLIINLVSSLIVAIIGIYIFNKLSNRAMERI